jgi:predicted alpha/beta superfamily hydrolase
MAPAADGESDSEVNMSFQKGKIIIPALMLMALLNFGGTFLLGQTASADGPTHPIQPVRIEKIASLKVGETREIWISLPDRYSESSGKYAVLYMMDADFNFNSGVIGGLRHAAQMGEMPEFIIVGIKNTNRSKDIFPEEVTYPDGSKDGGRADQYLDFIREELIPHIEKNYRTENYRVLFGTSNTGFTTVYGLLRNPELANSYVAASATMKVRFFIPKRDPLISGFKGGKRKLILVMGENDFPTILSGNGELKETIDTLAPPDLSCRFTVIGNGGHVPPNALLEGLRGLFEGWKIGKTLSEKTFAEIRSQADQRLEKFGLPGRLPEEDLKDLGNSLLRERKFAKALDVFLYLVDGYPRSADARVSLGDAYRQSGDSGKARECYEQALKLDSGHAAAAARLKDIEEAANGQRP